VVSSSAGAVSTWAHGRGASNASPLAALVGAQVGNSLIVDETAPLTSHTPTATHTCHPRSHQRRRGSGAAEGPGSLRSELCPQWIRESLHNRVPLLAGGSALADAAPGAHLAVAGGKRLAVVELLL